MKLNLKKCTFGAEEGTFLGHVVSMKGIKACLEKAKAVMKLQSPQRLKKEQSLNKKLESLNRFLSKSAEKSLPFFKTLKWCVKKSDFQWTPEAERAFQGMKQCIVELRMVTAPRPKEELIMYLCVAREAISAVLLAEIDLQQILVYFVSRALQAPEINYNSMEKLVLALVHATRRLRRYFQAHPVVVITDQPIKQILPDEEDPSMEAQAEEIAPEPWTLFTNRSSCLEGSGAGLILISPEGEEFTYALRFEFDASSNEAEYEALREILVVVEEEGYCWMTPLIEYLTEGTLPVEIKKARAIKIKTNGHVERVNRSLGEGIKARFGKDNKNWVEEVLHVLWAHCTMIKTSNRYTLFSLTYGTEAVIPVEIGMPLLRCAEINQAENDEGLHLNLDMLEERREKAAVREARRKAKMENYYDAKVLNTTFRLGDFVYRSNEASHAKDREKLVQNRKDHTKWWKHLGRGSTSDERGDGAATIKRRRQDLNGDGIRNLATASGRGRLKEDLEASTWRRRQDSKEYTPPATYLEEVEETLGTPIEVEPLDETQLEDLGLNTCNHDIPLSSREIPSFDEPEPQPQPFPSFPSIKVDLGDKRGTNLSIKPHSSDSFRMKEVYSLTIHTPPSPYVVLFHLKDMYCYHHPCLGDPKKHYGFKPGLLGQSRSLGVDFSNMEMIENNWELESKEVSFLGRGLNSPVRPKEVETVIFDEKKLGSS
ncbi:reverse transcriptase domain-containing protein [Tanacetum coccineum]